MNYNSVNLRTPSNLQGGLQGGAGAIGGQHITSKEYSSSNDHFVFPNCKDDQYIKIKQIFGNQLEFDDESRHIHMRRRSKSQPSTKRVNTGMNDTSSSLQKKRKQHLLKKTQLNIQWWFHYWSDPKLVKLSKTKLIFLWQPFNTRYFSSGIKWYNF